MFVLSIIILILAAVAYLLSRFLKFTTTESFIPEGGRSYDRETRTVPNRFVNRILTWVAIGLAALGALFLLLGSFYNQPEGTSMVQRDITGRIVGQTDDAGFHWKAPWVTEIEYNVRNQPVAFGNSQDDQYGAGYAFDGPQITVQDADKVSHNVDANFLYSLQSSKVTEIARSFADEQAFKDSYVFTTMRDVIRETANDFTTEQMLNDRASYREAIIDALEKRWDSSDLGVQLSEFSLQEVRSPEEVKKAFEAAAAAEINISTEESKLEAAKVSTQTRVAEAQADADAAVKRATGEAEANRLLAASLTPEVLEKLLIDAYGEGTVYVTDGSADVLIGQR
jgi:regulator of protease activity HflC (stomatin/prohibitin superfamily)